MDLISKPNLNNQNTLILHARIKELEEKLAKYEEDAKDDIQFYKVVFNSFLDLYYRTDLSGKIINVSPSCYAFSGFHPEEVIGKKVVTLYPFPADRRRLVSKLMKEGYVNDFEITLKGKSGKKIPVSVNSHIVKGLENQPDYIVGTLRDITERKRYENDLEKAQQLTRVGSWEWKVKSNTLKCSREMLRIFNLHRTSKNLSIEGIIATQVHEKYRDSVRRLWTEFEKDNRKTSVVFRINQPAKKTKWIRAASPEVLSWTEDDKPKVIIGTVQDITKNKLIKDKLIEKEKIFRAISSSPHEALIMMNHEGIITYWNQTAVKMFGFKVKEALGQRLHSIIAPEKYRKLHSSAFSVFQNTGKGAAIGKAVELRGLKKNGAEFPVELSISLIHLQDKWHSVGLIRDITDRREHEKSLEEASRSLKESNQFLEQATMMANELTLQAELANSAKSEFLANMSHEIRTPMNGIIGMTGLLLDTKLNPTQKEYAQLVKRSSDALLEIINDILDFSKIEAGKLELEIIEFDLREVLEDLSEILAVRAQGKHLEFLCRIDPLIPTLLKGDPGRLRQILVNLVGNAIKFTSKGEIVVSVSLIKVEDNSATILFEVKDTGIGIPENKKKSLFKAFVQADSSTTREYGGTGLGLSISGQLVKMMQGRINIESEVGVGSTFYFTIDLEKQLESKAIAFDIPEGIAGKNILIVDDNKTNRMLLKELLNSWKCRSEEVQNGKEALEKLRKAKETNDPFAIAIIDMLMPKMDGEMLGKNIKSDPELSETSLVMMTSLVRKNDISKFEGIGFSAYLTKPVRRSLLYNCLIEVINSAPGKPKPISQPIITKYNISSKRRKNTRILIAEDNLINQKVVLVILSKLGFQAEAVENGQLVLEKLKTEHYDLVFMDCQMPVLDGYKTTEMIRDPKTDVLSHHIPIIAMTANALKGDRERCLESGMDEYLSKPVNPEEIIEVINKTLYPLESKKFTKQAVDRTINQTVFDRNSLLDRLLGDDDLVDTILEQFLGDIPKQLNSLNNALLNEDFSAINLIGHTIKGASANVGAFALQDAAFMVEKAGDNSDITESRKCIELLGQQFKVLQKFIVEM